MTPAKHLAGASAVLRREIGGQTVYEPFWVYEDRTGLFVRHNNHIVRLYSDKTTSDPAWTIFQLSSDVCRFVPDGKHVRSQAIPKRKRRAHPDRAYRTTNNWHAPRRFVAKATAWVVVALLGGFLAHWTAGPAFGALRPDMPSPAFSLASSVPANWCCRVHPQLRGSIHE